jgi:hypothetical protein
MLTRVPNVLRGRIPTQASGTLLNPPHVNASEWAKVKEKQHLSEKYARDQTRIADATLGRAHPDSSVGAAAQPSSSTLPDVRRFRIFPLH